MEDDDNWVWVDVNAPPSAPRPAASPERLVREVDAADAWWTGVPHMVREILSVADACDGEMVLAARPTLVTVGDVDDLISAICDPGRRGTALVAAPIPDVPVPRLIGHVEQLTRECVGLAGIYVLDDFDPLGTWAARAWDMLRVLDGYAAARRRGEFSKGVHAYLGHTPPGRPGYAPGAHSTQESNSVRTLAQAPEATGIPGPQGRTPGRRHFQGRALQDSPEGPGLSPDALPRRRRSGREDLRRLHRQAPPERAYELDIRGIAVSLSTPKMAADCPRRDAVVHPERSRPLAPPPPCRPGGHSAFSRQAGVALDTVYAAAQPAARASWPAWQLLVDAVGEQRACRFEGPQAA